MKTDTLFYRIFQSFPSIFFELIDQPPTLAEVYQFSSVEVKQLAFRIDGVFLPTRTASNSPIYFAEVQFQSDPKFYSRFFTEIFLYLDKTDLENDWRGVVVYPTRNLDPGNQPRYQELLASNRVRRIYLNELGTDAPPSLGIETVKLIVESEENATTKARELIQQAREEVRDTASLAELLQLISTIIIYKFPKKSWEEVKQMLGITDLTQTRVYQEGKQEGLQEGQLRAKLEMIPRLFSAGMSIEQIARITALDIIQVQEIIASLEDK